MLAAGVLAVIAGLAFKIALVPFHGWAPDVYQGMTTPAVAFLSTAPKAGAVLVLARVLHALFPAGLGDPWRPLLAILAAASILFGNIVALSQRDLKRMLAYSGIAQMGYVTIGLATFTLDALRGRGRLPRRLSRRRTPPPSSRSRPCPPARTSRRSSRTSPAWGGAGRSRRRSSRSP